MKPDWFYLRAGDRQGPVDLPRLLAVLLAATEPSRVKVWREGMPDWKDAGELPELNAKLPPPGPSLRARDRGVPSVTFKEAAHVARLYRRLVVLVAIQLFLGLVVGMAEQENASGLAVLAALVAFVGMIAVFVGLLVTAYKLTKRLGWQLPTLGAIGMCIPFVNLFMLAAISSSAKAWCTRYGITIGFLGPTKESLERLRRGEV